MIIIIMVMEVIFINGNGSKRDIMGMIIATVMNHNAINVGQR